MWYAAELVLEPAIPYGAAIDPATGKTVTLLLDVLSPPASDERVKRPVIVCIHGGYFRFGDRSSHCGQRVREYLARRGYVAASIDYRLTGKENLSHYGATEGPSYADKMWFPARDAAHDAKAAVRFLRSNAAKFRIDPDRIALVGHSAGAIASLYAGYHAAIGEGDSGNVGVSSRVKAVVAFAGSLQPAPCHGTSEDGGLPIDCEPAYADNLVHLVDGEARPQQPALLLVHGTKDNIVPYDDSAHIHRRAKATGLNSGLVVLEGQGHDVNWVRQRGYRLTNFLREALELEHAECPTQSASRSEL